MSLAIRAPALLNDAITVAPYLITSLPLSSTIVKLVVVRLVTEPLKVMLPEVVTVPESVRPLAVPVPATEVTEPPPEPAPMAVRKSAAFKDETVLSALNRGNVTALGLLMMNRFAPSVVAPKFVRAPEAVVAPDPPCATLSAVVNPVSEVMSELAPLAAALRFALAPDAVVAPVPPEATGRAVSRVSEDK